MDNYKAEADALLKALLRYSGDFYSEAIEHGMPAQRAANAVAHVEKAARRMHQLLCEREESNIKEITDRFLGWTLPYNFSPDCGIKFDPDVLKSWPGIWPMGTNLFDADQATEMVRYILDTKNQATNSEAIPIPVNLINRMDTLKKKADENKEQENQLLKDVLHVGNEWADVATNGLQWVKNARDGFSTLQESIDDMEIQIERVQADTADTISRAIKKLEY